MSARKEEREMAKAKKAAQVKQATAAVEDQGAVRRDNCGYYEKDVLGTVFEYPVPIIVAHDMCKKTGKPCEVTPEGYCRLGVETDATD